MAIPLIASLLAQGLQKNNEMTREQQALTSAGPQEQILQARQKRLEAQNQIQPRIGIGGMTLPGDAMARQNGVFESILSKYGQGWRGLNAGGAM